MVIDTQAFPLPLDGQGAALGTIQGGVHVREPRGGASELGEQPPPGDGVDQGVYFFGVELAAPDVGEAKRLSGPGLVDDIHGGLFPPFSPGEEPPYLFCGVGPSEGDLRSFQGGGHSFFLFVVIFL